MASALPPGAIGATDAPFEGPSDGSSDGLPEGLSEGLPEGSSDGASRDPSQRDLDRGVRAGSPLERPRRSAPLTDRLLRSWLRCRRRAWLDRHGPSEQRLWSAHRALALDEQLRCFQVLLPTRPGRGEEACRRGEAGVIGLRLYGRLETPGVPAGLALEAHPPLLQRVEGPSRWGSFAYRPVLARQGRHLTREHRLQLALWGRLLAEQQGGPVPRALALGRGARGLEREQLPLGGSLQRQLEESLWRLETDLQRSEPPPLVNDRKKCVLCSWRGLCDQVATAEGHLSEVSGIGGKRRDLLLAEGITSVQDLAAADPERLAADLAVHGEQHREVAAQLVAQAQVQAQGRPRRLQVAVDPARGAIGGDSQAQGQAQLQGQGHQADRQRQGLALPELQQAAGVLIYDIESDPDARDDFLHGILRLKRCADGTWPQPRSEALRQPLAPHPAPSPLTPQTPRSDPQVVDPDPLLAACRYQPLLALQEHGERQLWRRLKALLERYPDWPVLHYGETESINLLRLAERMGASPAERQRLRGRLVDVHQRIRLHWLLPVNSYGLKAVAAWRGFRWSQSGVDGARCLLWWRQWRLGAQRERRPGRRRPARERLPLQRIFTYNRDDCLATWWVSCWLLEQDQAVAASTGPRRGSAGTKQRSH